MLQLLKWIEATYGWPAKRRYIRALCEAHAKALDEQAGRPVPTDDTDEDEPEGR